jgi:hypothetical protein
MSRKRFGLSTWLFILLITIPYLIAGLYPKSQIFGGFLFNPIDSNSYLAKMYEGWSGAWQFTMPFTAEKGDGSFLFMFYLVLGHISRITGLSLILIFHLTRLLSAGFLAYTLMKFSDWVFADQALLARRALRLTLLGSGLGWVFVVLGWITSDLWVAETYPFLAGFANPHFCLGMGLLLFIFMDLGQPASVLRLIRLAGAGFLLAVIMPFGIAVAGAIGGLWLLWEWVSTRRLQWKQLLAAFCLGGPAILYQYWVTLTDPLLSQWNAQNVTPSPPLWDLAIALSPALMCAVWGAWRLIRQPQRSSTVRLLLVWFLAGLVLIYFPFSLQRRFMFAYFIPVGFLAVEGLRELPWFARKIQKRAHGLVMITSLVTNGVVLLLALYGVAITASQLYVSKDEIAAFEFMRASLPPDAIVLGSADTGNLIPGWTGRRVLYGHKFETINAEENKKLVTRLYADQIPVAEVIPLLQQRRVQYIFMGPRERGNLDGVSAQQNDAIPQFLEHFKVIYHNETVQIYAWP